jgi:hypothetical protein
MASNNKNKYNMNSLLKVAKAKPNSFENRELNVENNIKQWSI